GEREEPDQRRLRECVEEAFGGRAILEMEPRILAIADELADRLFAQGIPADLVERCARQLPLAVICELLGLPLADRAKFTAWAGGFMRFTGTIGFISMIPKIVVSFYAMRRYLEQQLEVARKSGGGGVVAGLGRGREESR